MSDIDEAFYKMAIAQRDAAWAENAFLRQSVREAVVLLDFEAHLGPIEHQAVLLEVVRQLTAALEWSPHGR